MKKILSILAVLVCAIALQAGTGSLTAPTVYGPVGWEPYASFTPTTDTISGADTATFSSFTKLRLEPGYIYAVRVKCTVPAADSIRFQLLSYGTDNSTLIETTDCDTVLASATSATFQLPVYSTVLGYSHTLRAVGWVSNKSATFSRIEIWKGKLAR